MYDLGEKFHLNNDDALCNPSFIFKGKNYRISVLTERLVRLEYNSKGVFEDRPTALVINRKFEPFILNVKDENGILELKTKYFRLLYLKEKSFIGTKMAPSTNLKIDLLGTDKYWYYNNLEVKNLLGSSINLENIDKGIVYEKGLYSRDGFASINDANNYILEEQGMFIERKEKIIDTYVFMYGNDFSYCLQDYFKLTGKPPLVPRYALGLWWCRDHAYDEKLIEKLVENFKNKEIPISVLLLDKKWNMLKDGAGNIIPNSFRFNYELYPNTEKFIKHLHDEDIKLGLTISPDYGISAIEEKFEDIKAYINWPDNKTIPFGILNPKFLDAYLKFIISPLEQKGVDFFFIDTKSNNKNFLWPISHYHYINSITNNKRGLVLCKNSNIASHRYPVLYSGRTKTDWNTLSALPVFNQTSANIGLAWFSHDIGGYSYGIEEEELYLRYAQFGTYSPIFRFHAPNSKYYKREPWRWSMQTYQIVKDAIKLRYRLIPYIYTESYKYHLLGIPIIRPIYYKVPEIYDEPEFEKEYYFGSELLVAPITEKKNLLLNRVIKRIFLPDGVWYDVNYGKKYLGNKKYVSFFKDEDYPVYARSGAIIPMNVLKSLNDTNIPKELEIQVFPGKSNTYELYEDDGNTNMYKEGYYIITSIKYEYTKDKYNLVIKPVKGKTNIIPNVRDYKIRFRNTKMPANVNVTINGGLVSGKAYTDLNDLILEIKNVSTIGELNITCSGTDLEISSIKVINDDIDSIIYDIPVETEKKEYIANIMFGNLSINKKRIEIRKLKKQGIDIKYITIFLKLLEYIGQL